MQKRAVAYCTQCRGRHDCGAEAMLEKRTDWVKPSNLPLCADHRACSPVPLRFPASPATCSLRAIGAAADRPLAPGFEGRYHHCVLQHALKVIGRFYFLERVRGRPGYLAYLPAVYAAARRTFASLPELASAQALVARHVPELAPGST